MHDISPCFALHVSIQVDRCGRLFFSIINCYPIFSFEKSFVELVKRNNSHCSQSIKTTKRTRSDTCQYTRFKWVFHCFVLFPCPNEKKHFFTEKNKKKYLFIRSITNQIVAIFIWKFFPRKYHSSISSETFLFHWTIKSLLLRRNLSQRCSFPLFNDQIARKYFFISALPTIERNLNKTKKRKTTI